MPMTSRERVLAAFDHREPDVVPRWCGAQPEFWENAKTVLGLDDEGLRLRFGDDFRRVYPRYVGPEFALSPGAKLRTMFGVEHAGVGCGIPLEPPLRGAAIREIEEYAWPDPSWLDPSSMRADAEPYVGRYAILGGDWSPFWHDLLELLGTEDTFCLMVEDPSVVDLVLARVLAYYVAVSESIFEATGDLIDVFFIGNDFGTQHGPMMSLDLFRRFIKPHLATLVSLGKRYGKRVMMHSCGSIVSYIPDLIEIGLDGLHAVQPSAHGMDLRELKRRFGGQILFNGAIDSQHVLIEGTPESVRAATFEVLEIMSPGGGYVAGASHDTIMPETPLENVLAMFDAVEEYGCR